MKALLERYLNEIVGLTIMGLMALALIAGQADAALGKSAAQELADVVAIEVAISDRH